MPRFDGPCPFPSLLAIAAADDDDDDDVDVDVPNPSPSFLELEAGADEASLSSRRRFLSFDNPCPFDSFLASADEDEEDAAAPFTLSFPSPLPA